MSRLMPIFGYSRIQCFAPKPRNINRAMLQEHTNLGTLYGPEEKSKAKKVVAGFSVLNTALGGITAQAPGVDELCLAGEEVAMAMTIINGIYNFGIGESTLKSLLTGLLGNRVGTATFKGISKGITWVPGAGNIINAGVAGTTTAVLGAAVIDWCERADAERKRGKSIDDIIEGK